MTEAELYKVYAKWTGQLHFYCEKYLGAQLNCEFDPADWSMRLYPGPLQEKALQPWGFATVPGFERPRNAPVYKLPRPETDPSQIELDLAFKALCYAAAVVLKIDVSKGKLEDGPAGQPDSATLESTHVERPGPQTELPPRSKERRQRKRRAG